MVDEAPPPGKAAYWFVKPGVVVSTTLDTANPDQNEKLGVWVNSLSNETEAPGLPMVADCVKVVPANGSVGSKGADVPENNGEPGGLKLGLPSLKLFADGSSDSKSMVVWAAVVPGVIAEIAAIKAAIRAREKSLCLLVLIMMLLCVLK